MFYSGLLITCAPEHFAEVKASLESLHNVEVFQSEDHQGRIVAVLEGRSVEEETDIFEKIRTLPHVADVSLIVHRQDEESSVDSAVGNK